MQRALAADPPCQHVLAVIEHDRGRRRVERLEQLLQGRRGLVVRHGEDGGIGQQPALEPCSTDPRLHGRLSVMPERDLRGVESEVHGAGPPGSNVGVPLLALSGPSYPLEPTLLLGRRFSPGPRVDAPRMDQVLDPGLVIDRQRCQPGLRHERDGILALDRQDIGPARRQSARRHARCRREDRGRRDRDPPNPEAGTHEALLPTLSRSAVHNHSSSASPAMCRRIVWQNRKRETPRQLIDALRRE